VELLWDLVFVFAVTQVTTLLSGHLTWAGFGRSMLVLALVWWAWSAFVWAANAQAADAATLRLTLLVAMVLIFVAGLAIPGAFGGNATLFVATYASVRVLHLALYADASRRGNASWSAIVGSRSRSPWAWRCCSPARFSKGQLAAAGRRPACAVRRGRALSARTRRVPHAPDRSAER
jgi:hypothetical protein